MISTTNILSHIYGAVKTYLPIIISERVDRYFSVDPGVPDSGFAQRDELSSLQRDAARFGDGAEKVGSSVIKCVDDEMSKQLMKSMPFVALWPNKPEFKIFGDNYIEVRLAAGREGQGPFVVVSTGVDSDEMMVEVSGCAPDLDDEFMLDVPGFEIHFDDDEDDDDPETELIGV